MPLKMTQKAKEKYQNSTIFANILVNAASPWSREIRYLELEFMYMESMLIQKKELKKSLDIINEARKLYL
jgi:glycerol-3-phosphate dehydrogenase